MNDPQFEKEPEQYERAEQFINALYDLADEIDTARETIRKTREELNTRRLNEVDRLLSEAEDKVVEMLERG
jgi:Txe/YoeB family toxin of Txe-Axe toxin-antitoxin module